MSRIATSSAADAVAAIALAAGLVVLAFLCSSSADPVAPVSAGYTWSLIIVLVLGAAACATVPLLGARGPAYGAGTVALFAAFTALAALSIAWSVAPDWSWFGANQLLAYLAALAGAVALGRVFPERWPALIAGLGLAAAVLSGYALLAKVFPDTLAAGNAYGRVQAPFGYWNALGAVAAVGLAPCLWWGARAAGRPAARALSVPATTLILSVVILSYSRSALLAAVIGGGLWLVVMPLRLRALALAAVAAVGAAVIVAWAQRHVGVSGDNVPASLQDAAGHRFGVVVAAVLAAVTAAGWATVVAFDRITLPAGVRRRVVALLMIAVAMLPLAGVVALAASSRGLTGEISHGWSELTNPTVQPGDTASRITQLGSSRPLYWHEGLQVGAHAPLAGAGELGYGIARLRYTTQPGLKTDQAHSYLVQTFADLGVIGLALTLAQLVAWAIAAARPLAPRQAWSALADSERRSEREGMVTLAAAVLAFGVQSALDWTWFFAGVTLPALLAAGWLAGRGPLAAPVGRIRRRRGLSRRPAAAAAVTALSAVALLGGWLLWQPLRSAQQLTAAEGAPTTSEAFSQARAAAATDPLAIEPLNLLANLYLGIGARAEGRAQLLKAVGRQPDNPQPWGWLGAYDLQTGRAADALSEFRRVLALDRSPDPDTAAAAAGIAQAAAHG